MIQTKFVLTEEQAKRCFESYILKINPPKNNLISLLYLNPESTLEQPIFDVWTETMQLLFDESKIIQSWGGSHKCTGCGEFSTSHDYQIENTNIQINSLCVHYLSHHRDEIDELDWIILDVLKEALESNSRKFIQIENTPERESKIIEHNQLEKERLKKWEGHQMNKSVSSLAEYVNNHIIEMYRNKYE